MSVTRTGSIIDIHSSANSGSQAVTVPDDAEIMVCGVIGSTADSINDFLSGNPPTIGGQAMSMVRDDDDNFNIILGAIFQKTSPPTGSQTFAWNWGGTNAMPVGGHILIGFYKGVDTANPIRSTGGSQDLDNSATTGSLTAVSGDAAFAVAGAYNNTTLPTITWTNATDLDDDASNNLQGSCAEAFPAGNVTITATHSGGSGTGPVTTISAVILRQLFTVNAAGSDAPAGAIARDVATAYAGQAGPSGEPDLGVQTSLAGSVAPAGALGAARVVPLTVIGVITAVGNLIKSASVIFSGAVAATGNLLKTPQVAFSGSVTGSGTLDVIRAALLDLVGVVASSGAIVKNVLTAYAGQIGPDGEPNLGVQTSLGGSITPSGALAVMKIVLLTVTGVITGTGNLIKSVLTAFVGQVDASGNPMAGVQTSLSGSVTASGALSLVSSAITLGEAFFRGMFRGMFKGMR